MESVPSVRSKHDARACQNPTNHLEDESHDNKNRRNNKR
jgi:hypothetical protein